MNRRELINTFALAPVLPWVALKGIESPCKLPKHRWMLIEIVDEHGVKRIFEMPGLRPNGTCQPPTEKE